MGKAAKNINLYKRTNNRQTNRPPTSGPSQSEDDEIQPTNIKEKRASEKKAQKDSGAFFWDNLGGKLFYPLSYMDNDWKLSLTTIFKISFSIRVTASFWSIISDCDEVYNYWEPLHLFLFGRGFQTWEYSPIYAIRSYFYIYVHYIPAQLFFPLLYTSKVGFFHTIRFIIGLFNLVSELVLYESVCQRLGNSIGRFYIILSIFSVGLFNSSCAFLPSSFSMTMNAFAIAAYLREQWFLGIFCTAISALVGWPFAAVLGLPIVVEMCLIRYRHLLLRFVLLSFAAGALVLVPMYLVDTFYYGRPVLAPLNIVLYNVFSAHGPDLYGVAPVSYYIKNLLLNWNLANFLALIALPLALFVYMRTNYVKDEETEKPILAKMEWNISYWYRFMPLFLVALSVLAWLAIFFTQPHKEERFLFPVFPLIALLAGVGIDAALRVLPSKLASIPWLLLLVYIVICLSRGWALHRNYSGTLETYKSFHDHFLFNQQNMDFSKMKDPIRLCVGKEWHRYYSSFFLQEQVVDKRNRKRRIDMHFLRSEFRGLLPKPFIDGKLPKNTRHIPDGMNDLNQEEMDRYIDVESCDYIIDLDDGNNGTEFEPNYSAMVDKWRIIASKPFLIAEESNPIFRAFYLPFTNEYLKYGNYLLLERIQD